MLCAKYSVEELEDWLNLNGLSPQVCDALRDNNINGKTFLKLRRSDLLDLFPDNFLMRKEVSDFLDDLKTGDLQPTPLPLDLHQATCDTPMQAIQMTRSEKQGATTLTKRKEKATSDAPIKAIQMTQSQKQGATMLTKKKEQNECVIVRETGDNERNAKGHTMVEHQLQKSLPRASDSDDDEIYYDSDETFDPNLEELTQKDFSDDDSFHFESWVELQLQKCRDIQNESLPQASDSDDSDETFDPEIEVAQLNTSSEEETEESCSILKETELTPIEKFSKKFRFPIPQEFSSGRRPAPAEVNKFIRECVACLQAQEGITLGTETLRMGAQANVLYSMKRRLYNSKYYFNTNKQKKPLASLVQPDEKEEEKMYQQLEAEMKRETSRYEVLHHLMSLTFKSRRSAIDQIEEKDVTKVVMEQYPFLGNEKALMVEMELRTKCRFTDMKENWKDCKESLTRNVYRMVHMKVPDKDECDIPDDEDGALIMHLSDVFGCEPLIYFLDKNEDVEAYAKGKGNGFNTEQPWLIVAVDNEEDEDSQAFLVADRKVVCEVEPTSYIYCLFILMAFHYALNIAYKNSQNLLYKFIEEFFLGITPTKKNQKYRKLVQDLFAME